MPYEDIIRLVRENNVFLTLLSKTVTATFAIRTCSYIRWVYYISFDDDDDDVWKKPILDTKYKLIT